MQEVRTADFELDEDNINAETMKIFDRNKDSVTTNNEENKKEETKNSDEKKDSATGENNKSDNPNENKNDSKDDNKTTDKTESEPKRTALSMKERIALRKERFAQKKVRKTFEKKKSETEELQSKIASRKRRFRDLNEQTLSNSTQTTSKPRTQNACESPDVTEIKRRKKFQANDEMAEKIRTRLTRFASILSTDNSSDGVSKTNVQTNAHDSPRDKIQQRLARFAVDNSALDPLSSSAKQFEEIKKKRLEKFAKEKLATKISSNGKENGHNKQLLQKQLIQQRLRNFGLDTSTTNTQLSHDRAQTQMQLLEQRKQKFQTHNGRPASSTISDASTLKDKLKLRQQRFQNSK